MRQISFMAFLCVLTILKSFNAQAGKIQYHKNPVNFDLCAKLNEEIVYFNTSEWHNLSSAIKDSQSIEKLGLVIDCNWNGKETFLLALGDKKIGEISYFEVYDSELYHQLPDFNQCLTLSKINVEDLNKVLSVYDGHPLLPSKSDKNLYQYWSKDRVGFQQYLMQIGPEEYDKGAMAYSVNHCARLRDIYPLPYVLGMETQLNLRKSPENLDLAVELNGNRYYVNYDEWQTLSHNHQFHLKKIGIAFVVGEDKFIYKVIQEPKPYTWDQAMSEFPNEIVNRKQMHIINEFGLELFNLIEVYYQRNGSENNLITCRAWSSAPDEEYNDESYASYFDFGKRMIASYPKSWELDVVLVENL